MGNQNQVSQKYKDWKHLFPKPREIWFQSHGIKWDVHVLI